MMIYEAYSIAEEFDVYSGLELRKDASFVYSEGWSSYGGGFGFEARGVWRKDDKQIFLRPDLVDEGGMRIKWIKDQECQASISGDELIFQGSFTMSLKREVPAQVIPAVESKENAEPVDLAAKENPEPISAADKKPKLPAVANLHFKNGQIREIQTPANPLFGLTGITFYRLTDENGKTANVFKLREASKTADSTALEFDEIDYKPVEAEN